MLFKYQTNAELLTKSKNNLQMLNIELQAETKADSSTADAQLSNATLAQNAVLVAALSAKDYANMVHTGTNHLYDDKPYLYHLSMVVDYCIKFLNLIPIDKHITIIQSAWLHDTIEDCRVTFNDIKKEFSQDVAEIVYALTNEKGQTRKDRASYEYYLGIKSTPYATFVKICDRLANIQYSKNTNSRMFEVYKEESKEFSGRLYQSLYRPMFDEMNIMLLP